MKSNPKGRSSKPPGLVSRRQARRDAMVILYQHDLTGAGIDALYENHRREKGYPPDDFTRAEVEAVLDMKDEIDATIDAVSQGWPAHRLAALERNILRIAIFELYHRRDIPTEVSIDEAVALAKRYCSNEAGSLVNGILGKIAGEGESK